MSIILLITFFLTGGTTTQVWGIGRQNDSNEDLRARASLGTSTSLGTSIIIIEEGDLARRLSYDSNVIGGELMVRFLVRNIFLAHIWTIYPTPNIEFFLGPSFGVVWWPFGLNMTRIEQKGFFSLVWDFADFFITLDEHICWNVGKPIYIPYFYLFTFKEFAFLNVYLFDLISFARGIYLNCKKNNRRNISPLKFKKLEIEEYMYLMESFFFSFRISVDHAYLLIGNKYKKIIQKIIFLRTQYEI